MRTRVAKIDALCAGKRSPHPDLDAPHALWSILTEISRTTCRDSAS